MQNDESTDKTLALRNKDKMLLFFVSQKCDDLKKKNTHSKIVKADSNNKNKKNNLLQEQH